MRRAVHISAKSLIESDSRRRLACRVRGTVLEELDFVLPPDNEHENVGLAKRSKNELADAQRRNNLLMLAVRGESYNEQWQEDIDFLVKSGVVCVAEVGAQLDPAKWRVVPGMVAEPNREAGILREHLDDVNADADGQSVCEHAGFVEDPSYDVPSSEDDSEGDSEDDSDEEDDELSRTSSDTSLATTSIVQQAAQPDVFTGTHLATTTTLQQSGDAGTSLATTTTLPQPDDAEASAPTDIFTGTSLATTTMLPQSDDEGLAELVANVGELPYMSGPSSPIQMGDNGQMVAGDDDMVDYLKNCDPDEKDLFLGACDSTEVNSIANEPSDTARL